MPSDVVDEIKRAYTQHGRHNWIHSEDFGHFQWGMGCRNALRTAGFKDDQLPQHNWDDYYVQVVEAAVGLR